VYTRFCGDDAHYTVTQHNVNNAHNPRAKLHIYTPKYQKIWTILTALKLKLISTHLINTQNTLLKSHLTIVDIPRTKFSPGSTNKPKFQHDEQAIAWTFHHTRTSNHPLQWPIRITKRSMIPNYSFLPWLHTNDKSHDHRPTHQNSIATPANPNHTDHHQKP